MPRKSKASKPLKGIPVPIHTPSPPSVPPAVAPSIPSAVPGILTQIATNAAGTALGHVVAHQIIGGATSESKSCAKEIAALLQCGKENSDLNFCADFLEKLRQCV